MSDREPPVRPSLRDSMTNWRESSLPFLSKLRLTARNNFIKLRTRRNCCGNYGQPGC
jgi:hypothetical protein